MSDASYWRGFEEEVHERVMKELLDPDRYNTSREQLIREVVELTLSDLLSHGYLLCRGGMPQKRN